MKVVKLTNKMLKLEPADLLINLNAVNGDKEISYPQYVYFSKKDYGTLKNNLKKKIKKDEPWRSVKGIENAVGYEMLNYGPNQTLQDAIKTGYCLIDEERITVEIVTNKLTS